MTNFSTETESESYEAAELAQIALEAAIEAVENHQRRTGRCDAPFRCVLHVDNGNEADREGSFPPDSIRELLDRGVPDGVQTHDDGWTDHNGDGHCPIHRMDMIQTWYGPGAGNAAVQAGHLSWAESKKYRPLRDPDGVPYCSAEGLESWAEYVATDETGEVWQYSIRPSIKHAEQWDAYTCSKSKAPDCFAHGDHWTNTLRRVYRREGA